MGWKEILDIIWVTLAIILFIIMVIYWIKDIKASNANWKKMNAGLDLLRTTAKREHELRHAVIAFGDWLMDEYEKAKNNMYNEENDYNNGKLTATQDITGEFLNTLEEYIGDWEDGRKKSDNNSK